MRRVTKDSIPTSLSCARIFVGKIRYHYGMADIRKRKLLTFCIVGFFFVCGLGAASHFFYEWSGYATAAGILFPANESVWEHLKLVFFPTLVYFLVAAPFMHGENNYLFAAFIANALAALFIPLVFYTYTAFTGEAILAVDIASFAVGVLIGFVAAYGAMRREVSPFMQVVGGLGLALIVAAYLTLTAYAPELPLFCDPTTGGYGLKGIAEGL